MENGSLPFALKKAQVLGLPQQSFDELNQRLRRFDIDHQKGLRAID